MSIDKVMALDAAMARVKRGTRLMMGEFVGFGEPARCIEWLIANNVGDLTLITNTPGLRGGSPMAGLFGAGLVRELIGAAAATSTESSEAYLAGKLTVTQFFPMGTWAEKVRAGGVGLGGVLVPVGVGILDAEGLFPDLEAPKPTIELNGKKYFAEPARPRDGRALHHRRGKRDRRCRRHPARARRLSRTVRERCRAGLQPRRTARPRPK